MMNSMRQVGLVGLVVGIASCSKPETTPTPIGSAAPSVSAPTAVAAVAPAAITKVKVTGQIARKPSWSFMPGGKNPSGKSQAGTSFVVNNPVFDPPQAAGTTLNGALKFENAGANVTEPPVGKCKATFTSHRSSPSTVGLDLEEPGCNTLGIQSSSPNGGLKATAKGQWLVGGTPKEIDVEFDLKAAEQAAGSATDSPAPVNKAGIHKGVKTP